MKELNFNVVYIQITHAKIDENKSLLTSILHSKVDHQQLHLLPGKYCIFGPLVLSKFHEDSFDVFS